MVVTGRRSSHPLFYLQFRYICFCSYFLSPDSFEFFLVHFQPSLGSSFSFKDPFTFIPSSAAYMYRPVIYMNDEFIYCKSKEGYCFTRLKRHSSLSRGFSFALFVPLAAKFHDLTAKESDVTNTSLRDPLVKSDGRFVINNH